MRTRSDIAPELPSVWQRDAFWRTVADAATPLAIWGGHFFAAYVFIAIGCRAGLDARMVAGSSALTLGLAALTLLALAWLVIIMAGSAGSAGASAAPRAIRFGTAALAWVAVAWTAIPILLISSCLQ